MDDLAATCSSVLTNPVTIQARSLRSPSGTTAIWPSMTATLQMRKGATMRLQASLGNIQLPKRTQARSKGSARRIGGKGAQTTDAA
eukprot:4997146-Pleurochrysis_carterae.AAC.3